MVTDSASRSLDLDAHMTTLLAPTKLPVFTQRQEVLEMLSGEIAPSPASVIQVADRNQLIEWIAENEPLCLLLEVGEDESSELKLIGELHSRFPQLQIVALSQNWKVQTAVRAIKLGASEICDLPCSEGLVRNAIQQALQTSRSNVRPLHDLIPKDILEKLSSDEARILTLLIQGRTTKEVGATLDVSIRTIHYRKKTLLQKLGVQNRSEAIEMIRIANGSMTFL